MNIICIPVYKSTLTSFEDLSLRQCFKVLSNHPICLVTFPELDCAHYYGVAKEYSVCLKRENFDRTYFDGIDGYNKLMISKELYQRFSHYLYMLLYQLDAFVFRDELDYWCNKGYDYIGAPWFEKDDGIGKKRALWAVGNGGFSLRKIQSFLNIFDYNGWIEAKSFLRNGTMKNQSLFERCFMFIKTKGYRYKIDEFLSVWQLNEDFLPYYLSNYSNIEMSVPSAEEALSFAFENYPAYAYSLNNNKLPFGCHAWGKYQYDEFWSRFIY